MLLFNLLFLTLNTIRKQLTMVNVTEAYGNLTMVNVTEGYGNLCFVKDVNIQFSSWVLF